MSNNEFRSRKVKKIICDRVYSSPAWIKERQKKHSPQLLKRILTVECRVPGMSAFTFYYASLSIASLFA